MPERSRYKKAVSPVIANVLMVMAVFALGTILFAWATSSFGMYQGGAGVWFVNRGDAMKERLIIECVDFTGVAHQYIEIYVRNVGRIDFKIVAIYINGTIASMVTPSLSTGVTVTVGNVTLFRVTLYPTPPLYPWSAGSISTVMVATSRGNSATGTYEA